jgi:hypothetical protein
MPNNTVPAAVTGLPDVPRPPVRSRLVDDFNGPAGQLIALALAAHTAREQLVAALAQREPCGGCKGAVVSQLKRPPQ